MKQGNFVWYELTTTDSKAAADYYASVVRWTVEDSGMPGMTYLIAKVGDRQVAGIMDIMPMMEDQSPSWRGYIGVDDVDVMAGEVKAAGGAVRYGPDDIPGVGRFAVCTDPTGATFMIFKGAGDPPSALDPATPGAVGWHELSTSDWERAWDFYAGLFGWEKALAVEMGEMGTYQTFNVHGVHSGGMMNVPGAPPAWRYYATVEDIDAAARRITDNGGTIQNGPHEVPGGAWIVMALDPQGAAFAVSGPKK